MIPLRRLPPLVGLMVLLGPVTAGADILHLKDGSRIRVDEWWETDSEYVYSRFGGTIAIEKSAVARVERTEKPVPKPAPPAPEPSRPAPPPSPSGQLRLREEIRRGDEARQREDYAAAAQAYEAALRIDPTHLDAGIGRVAAYLSMERYAEALDAVNAARVFHPEEPTLLFLLGELHYRLDRLALAVAAWEQALQVRDHPAIRARIAKARRELSAEEEYDQIAGGHFRLRFEGGGGSDSLARPVLDHLENRIGPLSLRLDHFPAAPISVILYPEEDFHAATRTGHNVRGLFDGKIRIPTGGVSRLDEPFRNVLDHELVHALIDSKTGGNSPRWLHEGIAQYLAGDSSHPFRRTLGRQFGRLAGTGEWGPDLSYPHALSCVEFLAERNGFVSWLAVLDGLGRGLDFADALWESVRLRPRELYAKWGESLDPATARAR